ncbi:hypothetical protein GDO78_008990 [Eleutherodactylus coqui]|uniref:Uncharacterized protein n=1 Tax=Eleutherodactylus coqui TaxID=57060 RepID=A0A8J6FEF5_ELECQ|nr:hypothetical protein GDO78_008990 [Eleutherodactylus coqui]
MDCSGLSSVYRGKLFTCSLWMDCSGLSPVYRSTLFTSLWMDCLGLSSVCRGTLFTCSLDGLLRLSQQPFHPPGNGLEHGVPEHSQGTTARMTLYASKYPAGHGKLVREARRGAGITVPNY